MFNRVMKSVLMAGVVALAIAPVASAQLSTPKPDKSLRTAYGTPDLQGVWSNVSLTRLERAPSLGDQRVYTPEQAAKLEGQAEENVEYENKPTDPSVGAEDTSRKNCQGAGGRDCGYNAGWKDSTTQLTRVHGEPRTSFIVSTPNGRLPARVAPTDTARARALASREADNAAGEDGAGRERAGRDDNPETRSLGERCIISFGNNAGPPMLPNGYYNNNIRIVQGKDTVAILIEMIHDVRIVRIGGTHRTDGVKPWFGDSIGHYEGDTLVVETTDFNPQASFMGATENLKVTERFTREGPDQLLYQFTVEDPTVWTQPWSGEYTFTPTHGDIYEYACHEGNYGLEGILAGARAADQDASQNGAPTASR